MRGITSLCLFSFGAIAALGQAFAAREPAVQLQRTEPGPGGMAVTDVNSFKCALQTSRVSSFGIDVTFVNSINLANNTAADITFDGSSGPVGTFTVYSPPPGETAFFHFCLPAAGETSITFAIHPNACPCSVELCFDPHLQGLRGQHVEWVGADSEWYALVKDDEDNFQINVRTTAPLTNDFPDHLFITGMAVIEVKYPHTVETPGCSGDVSPCLADGGLSVYIDEELVNFLVNPANTLSLSGGIEGSSSNLPPECREFGGRKVWARMQKGMLRGRLQLITTKMFKDWILSFTHMIDPDFCSAFVANEDLSEVQSDQALLRIVTLTAVMRLFVGINYRRAGNTDCFVRELPELDVWQMGVGVEGLSLQHESLPGLLGGTARVVVDAEGNEVMEGTEALSDTIEDYRVSNAEGADLLSSTAK